MSIGRSPRTLGRHEEELEDAEPGKAGPVRVSPIAVSNGVTGAPFLSSTTPKPRLAFQKLFLLQQKPLSQDEGNNPRHERNAWP